jgi:hypothetical protein
MAPAPTDTGGVRWIPLLLTVVAAIQFGDLLAQVFIWHAAVVLVEAHAALVALFAVLAILSYWNLGRQPARPARAAEF